jgi:hypothetical protein
MRRFFAFYRITRLAILRLDAYARPAPPPSPFPDGLTGESAFQFSSKELQLARRKVGFSFF